MEKGSALPCICPNCDADYTRKKRKSPIRGFRTGFAKTNQVLAKELFSSLQILPLRPRKLVSFSDSREEAARFSNDVEKEHYNQLIKELFLESVELTKKSKLLFKARRELDRIAMDVLRKEIGSKSERLIAAFNDVYGQFPSGDILNELLVSDTEKELISVDEITQNIIHQAIRLRINPAGPDASSRELQIDATTKADWKKCFDWGKCEINNDLINPSYRQQFYSNIKSGLLKEMSSFIFGRLYFSIESSGIGIVMLSKYQHCPPPMESNLLYENIVNSFVRILGDNFKHNCTDFFYYPVAGYDKLSKSRPERRYVKAVSEHLGYISELDLGSAIWNDVIGFPNNHTDGILKIENLRIKFANREAKLWICDSCGTIHQHNSGGVCKFCFELLDSLPVSNKTAGEIQSLNFYSRSALRDEKAIRLRCEELTGQTDNQLERQRFFKNIITQKPKEIYQIDLLSVTTTLEVGIDIGSLQAIYQGNMPPQRFNYQQRVGRAGRANQAYSVAFTFCRGRSHDEYYFNNPERMTGDAPPVPFLSFTQKEIAYRVIIKGIFQKYFSQNPTKGKVHGEFGLVSDYKTGNDWNVNYFQLQKWLSNTENWQEIYYSLTLNLYNKNEKISSYRVEEFKNWLAKDFVKRFESTLKMPMSEDLAEAMAESGLLPLSGMPTRVRNLITGFKISKADKDHYDAVTIDRSVDLAIYEFAPASQKTKDKEIFTSIGITPNISGLSKKYELGKKPVLEADSFQESAFPIPRLGNC